MFKGASYWRNRAAVAEAELAVAKTAIAEAEEQLEGIQLRLADRAALVSITRDGRLNKFMFARNGDVIMVETYSTMEDNLPGWKKELLE